MDFALTETQTMIQTAARDFATRRIAPLAAELDRTSRFPSELLRGLAELGLMAVNVPESYGGAEAGAVAYALAMQEVAKACASTAVTMAVTNMVGEVIATFGTEEQKTAYCTQLAAGEFAAGSFALSEPDSGSDAGAMNTTAKKDGNEWVLSGGKQWITSGAHAGVFVVWARTATREELPGTRGVSCFLVPPETPGFRVGRKEDKMGLRASNTVAIEFDQCRLPASALLGELNGGFKIAMMALDGGRIGISAQAIGIARAALAEATAYAQDRKQFGKAIAEFQAVSFALADMKTEIDAAHLLCLRAASLKDAKKPFTREASMAKLFASEMANRVVNKAVQIHGGYGYIREFAAERHLRDARVTTIYEGTSEVQRMVIARSVLADG
jgi:alkylation response protein AidB-like acyl-CoA dehydrogenase